MNVGSEKDVLKASQPLSSTHSESRHEIRQTINNSRESCESALVSDGTSDIRSFAFEFGIERRHGLDKEAS